MAPRKGQQKKSASKAPGLPNEADNIVFTNAKGDIPSRTKKTSDNDIPPAAPRPDTKKIIGGASWTGKLPVNLLSEHCQREKWNKPDYAMRTVQKDGEKAFRSFVTLSKNDPKTRETTTLPPFDLPKDHQDQGIEPTALEARHFAATYALYRIASMKQIHMALPPKYRDFWKGLFADLKKEDVKEGRGETQFQPIQP
jgi:ATP-dependent RNA helicase DHX57